MTDLNFKNSWRVDEIQSVMLGIYDSLKNYEKFDVSDAENAPPSALVWTMYFLAQHYDQLGNTAKALQFVKLVEEHTPTMVEIHMIKAKIYKVTFRYTFFSLLMF